MSRSGMQSLCFKNMQTIDKKKTRKKGKKEEMAMSKNKDNKQPRCLPELKAFAAGTNWSI